jgi:hypothetical protein
MPGELFALNGIPASVAFRPRLQAGSQAVARQQPVRLEGQEVIGVQILRPLERACCKPDSREWQWAWPPVE